MVYLDLFVVNGSPFNVMAGSPSLKRLQAFLDHGERKASTMFGAQTVKLSLEDEHNKQRTTESAIDSEDFFLTPMLRKTDPLRMKTLIRDKQSFVLTIFSKEESDLENLHTDGSISKHEKSLETLHTGLSHFQGEHAGAIFSLICTAKTAAWSLCDHWSDNFPEKHSLDLLDPKPIHLATHGLPPRRKDNVREDLDKMLAAGAIPPASPDCPFPVVIDTKEDGKAPVLRQLSGP